MTRDNTPDEDRTKHEMIDTYRVQEHLPDGFNDWGMFTAHVVHSQRKEIDRLRALLEGHSIEAGEWEDPLGG